MRSNGTETKRRSLRSRLNEESCLGIFSKTTDSAFVEAAGLAGLDFIILDMEHGPAGWDTIQHHVRSACITGVAPIVRVPGLDAHSIGAAFDAGAEGVQVPNISSGEQAAAVVAAARFHPLGGRGVCRFVRAAGYGSVAKETYFPRENEKLLVLQVEGLEGVRNLNEILAVEGFDVLFVGPYDLSQSVGRPGEVEAPEVRSLIEDIAKEANARGKTWGLFCDTPEALARYKSLGVPYLSYSVDVSLFREALQGLRSQK